MPATPVKDLASNDVAVPMPVMGGTLALPHPPAEARKLAQAKLDSALTRLAAAGVPADGAVADPDRCARWSTRWPTGRSTRSSS